MQHSKTMLPNIQILRGFAALLVVISHLASALVHAELPNVMPDTSFGYFGVDLFFVISGFIMLHVTEPDSGPQPAARFLLRRMVRIIPLYWLFTTLTLVLTLHAYRHGRLGSFAIWHTIASYLFVPFPEMPGSTDIYPIYDVGWSLNYEMLFYVCFASAMLLAPRFRLPTVAGLFLGLALLGSLVDLPLPLSFWARSNILEFVFGMLVAQALRHGVRMPAWSAVALAAVGVAGVLVFLPYSEDWDALRGLGWGLPAAAIVAAGALVRRAEGNPLTRALEGLGDASYSLYLLHPAFYDGVIVLSRRAIASHDLRFRFLIPIMLIGAIAASFALYRMIERPMTRALQRAIVGRTSVVPATPPAIST